MFVILLLIIIIIIIIMFFLLVILFPCFCALSLLCVFFFVLSFIHGQHDYVAQFTWVVDIFYLNLMIIKQKHTKKIAKLKI